MNTTAVHNTATRQHLLVTGNSPAELGQSRGEQLRTSLGQAYAEYAKLFRQVGVSSEQEAAAVSLVLETLQQWRPEHVEQLTALAQAAEAPREHVVALNARTEILATGTKGSQECSTVTTVLDQQRVGLQTWDWHTELKQFWHTHEVHGPGYRFVGLSEQGILSKIGVNEAGLALHFNILGHAEDGASGVPMHLLSYAILSECQSVAEALTLIEQAPIGSSSALTLLEAGRAVSVELSPVGVFVIEETSDSVQRTNHFQHPAPLAQQKNALYEPDSSDRLTLIRERLAVGQAQNLADFVQLLASDPGQADLTCVPDLSLAFGERWETLATILTLPQARTMYVLDGKPTDAVLLAQWRELTLR